MRERRGRATFRPALEQLEELIVPSYVDTVLSNSPILYWRLGESGTTAFDTSPNGNNGTYSATGVTYGITGAIPTSGDTAIQVSPAGSGGTVASPNLASFFANETVTISVWFNSPSAGGVLVDELNAPGGAWHDSQIEVQTNGQVRISVWNLPFVSLGTASFNAWHNAVLRYNKTTLTLDGFLDGVQSATSSSGDRQAPFEPASGSLPLQYHLGRGDTTNMGNAANFNGRVDEFSVFNTALSNTQIVNMYKAAFPAVTASYAPKVLSYNPVLYWRLSESSGLTAFDASPNGANGTYTASNIGYGLTGGIASDPGNAAVQLVPNPPGGFVMSPNLTSYFGGNDTVTLSIWFNSPTGGGVVVDEIDGGWHDSQVEVLTSGAVLVRVWNLGAVSLGTASFNAWHHVVLRYNSSTQILDGFLDGVQSAGSSTGARQAPFENGFNQFYHLGRGDTTNMGNGVNFNGRVDEFSVFNAALTNQQIVDLYNSAFPGGGELTANPDSYSVFEDSTLNVPVATGVLANDEGKLPLSATVQTGPVHGTLSLNPNGSFTYNPDAAYRGPDSFSYRLTDGFGLTAVALVTLTVTAVNDPPIANNDYFAVDEDSPTGLLNVLANDSLEPDGTGTLNVIGFTPAPHGTVSISNGNILYTPDPGFTGVDNFSYTMTDGTAGSNASAAVVVVVAPVNDAPQITVPGLQIYVTNTDHTISGIAISDIDANFGSGIVQVTLSAQHGTLSLSTLAGLDFSFAGAAGDGIADASMTFRGSLASVNLALTNVIYKSNANFAGDDTIDIQVDDQGNFGSGGILSDSASFQLEHALDIVRVQPSVTKPGQTDLLVSGTNSGDAITVKMTGASKTKMTVVVNNTVIGKAFKPTGNILVYGLDNNDNITIQPRVKKQAFVDGGDANDTLTGGKANDILLGGNGSDSLNDAGGRDLFIGGAGLDVVLAGSGDDILIGGTTAYDDDGVALAAIMAEWSSLTTDYATRVDHLRGTTPGLNGSTTLTAVTVFDDGIADSLIGAADLDYYWLFAPDSSDLTGSELSN